MKRFITLLAVLGLITTSVSSQKPGGEKDFPHQAERDQGQLGPSHHQGPPPHDPIIMLFDTDRDSKLSQKEMEQATEILKKQDRDKNGVLTRDELPRPPRPPHRGHPPHMREDHPHHKKGAGPPHRRSDGPPQQRAERPGSPRGEYPPHRRGPGSSQQRTEPPCPPQGGKPPHHRGEGPPHQRTERSRSQRGEGPPHRGEARPPQERGTRPPRRNDNRQPRPEEKREDQKPQAQNTQNQSAGNITFTGGYQTDPRDHGRPVALIASALGVKPEVFRQAFSNVKPARGGDPTPARAQANKKVLMEALGKHGITNDRLDAVSNYYRYQPGRGNLWKHTPASAKAILKDGNVTGFKITNPGSGYMTPPTVSVVDHEDIQVKATLEFTDNFQTNGSIKSLTIVK